MSPSEHGGPVVGDVLAVVPTYGPGAEALDLIASLLAQGSPVVVSDDASPCTSDPTLRSAEQLGATVIRHAVNRGIARGLNDGLAAAAELGAPWLLTVDQDSALPGGYVDDLVHAAQQASTLLGSTSVGAVAAGRIADTSGDLGYPTADEGAVLTTAEVIQTGTLWSVPGLLEVGGFDESFGIDAVDAAACVRLRARGMRIVVVPELALRHRIGDGRQVQLLGRSVMATGHSANRRTSMVRNRLRLAPEEFRESPIQAIRSLRRVAVSTALAVTVEEDRWSKAKASARGLLPRRGR